MMDKIYCPYCKAELSKKPQRKTKCSFCGKYIYVKKTPTKREKQLFTEEQAKKVEAEWEQYHEHQHHLKILQSFGLSEKDLEKEKKGFFSKKSEKQAVWTLLQRIAKKEKNLQKKQMAYYQMAIISENEGREFYEFLKESVRCLLLSFKQRRIRHVKILTGGQGNSCDTCEQLSGNVLSIDEALKTMPIPCKKCTYTLTGNKPGFCRCSYIITY